VALAGGVAASAIVTCRYWSHLSLAAAVAKYTFQVWLIDHLPDSMRRRLLSREYSGKQLEKRLTQRIFKGMATMRALWRMSSINLRPKVRVGDPAPATPVLLKGAAVSLPSLASANTRPLLLNFGSCT